MIKGFLVKLGLKLRLLERHESFQSIQSFHTKHLVLPAGQRFEGELHTDLPVIVAGEFRGAINIRGDGKLIFLRDSRASGFFSANHIQVHSQLRDVALDADLLEISSTGGIDGESEIRYDKLNKHIDADVNGRFGRRRNPRDGYANLVSVVIQNRLGGKR